MKRIITSILLLSMIFTAAFSMAGCGLFGSDKPEHGSESESALRPDTETESETDTETVTESESMTETETVTDTESETETEPETDTEEGEDTEDYTPLTEGGKPLYVIMYQSLNIVDGLTGAANAGNYLTAANNLAAELEALVAGVDFSVVSDRKLSEQTLKVIALGRAEGVNDGAYDTLRYQDYAISESDGGIGIAAYNNGTLTTAAKAFGEALKVIDGDIYVKSSVLGTGHVPKYKINSITVGGKSINQYTIVCDASDKTKAQSLRIKICDLNGTVLSIVTEDVTGPVIILNKTDSEIQYGIEKNGENIIISYGTDMSWKKIMSHLTDAFNQVDFMGSIELDDICKTWTSVESQKIMSFNVKNVWGSGTPSTRDNVTAEMILGYMPDFVGLQEFDVPYREATGGLIELISEKYSEVEIAGADKKNIWNPIFYLKDKYTVVESGIVFFPQSAEGSYESEYVYGTDDALSKFRSLVWAVLEDTEGNKFLIGNLHFSPGNLVDISVVHVAEAQIVTETLTSVAERYEGCITLVTGDYNSKVESAGGAYEMLGAGFTDVYDLAKSKTDLGTNHDEGKLPPSGYKKNAIDHVLTLNSSLDVIEHLIIKDAYILDISDHCPTIVSFTV